MFDKLLLITFVLTVLCRTLTIAQTLKSDSKADSLKIPRQSNQWPSGQWNSWNKWPSAKWNSSQWPSANWTAPVTSYPWSPRPPNVVDGQTIYPPLPDISWPSGITWPTGTWKPQWTQRPHTSSTPSPASTEQPAPVSQSQSTSSSPKPPKITEQKPFQTKPTPSSTKPTAPPNPEEDPSKITVRSCGLSHVPHELNGNKIVSGKLAKPGEFPWQVILKINTARGNMQCGGAILNSKWVLTAAHCVSNERDGTPTANRIDITAGVNNRLKVSATSQQRTADCVIQHESWRGQAGNFKNDIALLRLPANKKFELTYEKGGHVNGICIPEKPMSEYSGKARIAGWGLTKDRGTPSDVLLYTDVSVITNDKCRRYEYPVPIADSMICQGVDGTAPCQGDSGGSLIIPLTDNRGVQRMTEVGIVSFGPGKCANPSTPNAIYTKVSHFLKWIEKTIASNGQRCASRPLRTEQIDKIGNNFENESNSTVSAENILF